ncbi:rhodanese-like domain-containing protein [Bacillaceae bacterium Marseille-Q3522]|nr:rhodanese-like domain-containing protein [Bacillaceae bacterium Marseille-Q3522]
MQHIDTITPREVEEMLETGAQLALIDVREAEEVAEGMIHGAKHIPMALIPEKLDSLKKGQEYIIICRSGHRSENVCDFLQERGYKVRNMIGGMLEWNGEIEFK